MKPFRRSYTSVGPALLAGLSWLGAPAAAQPPASSGFVLSQSTVSSGGATAVSSSFVLDGSAAQRATVGPASSASFALESGFWNSLSTLNVLRVEGAGSGGGSASAVGIACDLAAGTATGDCLEQVVHGTEVELVAVPAAAGRLDGWTGCDAVATTALPGDTCRLTLRESRTVTVGFTLLASVGARVWRDLNGDGIPDAGEPGIDGVEVSLADGGAFSETAVTAGGGFFAFADVPPGSYTLAVNAATLPPGVFPSFDPDGVATPHTAVITLTDGEDFPDADFGYHPLADLVVTKQASSGSLPASGALVYTITVENLGPASATDVVVLDVLPPGLVVVATSGCAEDPGGVPACSLGNLPPGAFASYTIEVATESANLPGFVNTASVEAAESDPDPSNNTSTVATAATPVLEIPVAGSGGLLLLALLLAAVAVWKLR